MYVSMSGRRAGVFRRSLDLLGGVRGIVTRDGARDAALTNWAGAVIGRTAYAWTDPDKDNAPGDEPRLNYRTSVEVARQ